MLEKDSTQSILLQVYGGMERLSQKVEDSDRSRVEFQNNVEKKVDELTTTIKKIDEKQTTLQQNLEKHEEKIKELNNWKEKLDPFVDEVKSELSILKYIKIFLQIMKGT